MMSFLLKSFQSRCIFFNRFIFVLKIFFNINVVLNLMSTKVDIPEKVQNILKNAEKEGESEEIDITDIFYQACETLKSSVLSICPDFSLNEAMQAVDMMNAQMDSGMVFIDPPTQGLENSLHNGSIDVENMSSREIVAIIDATWGCFVSWLNLIPLDQSFYTNVLLHDPNVIVNPVLKASMNAFLTISTIFADVIEAMNTYSEEDIIIHSYRRQANIAKELNKFNDGDSVDVREGKLTILYRLRSLETMILLLKFLLPLSDNEEIGNINFKKAKTLVATFKASIKASNQTISYGLQPENGDDSNYEWLSCFQPEVNRYILPATFPKRLKCTSRNNAYEELRRITFKLEEITNINEEDIYDVESIGAFLKNYSRNNSCLITRCFVHLVLLPLESKLFGTISLHDLYLRNISLDTAIGLFNRNGNLHEVILNTIQKEWGDYCKVIVNLYANIFQNYTRNISRQMENISSNIAEAFGALPYVTHFDRLLEQRFTNDIQLNGKFSYHINNLLLDLSADYFELGFRTDLYLPYEFDYIYWYLFEICYPQKVAIYEQTINFMENEKAILIKGGNLETVTKKMYKLHGNTALTFPNIEGVNFKFILRTSLIYLYKSYFFLVNALKRQGLIKNPSMDHEEYRFNIRFSPLGPLINFFHIDYQKYFKSKEDYTGNKVSLITLYENSLQALNRCVTYLNRIPSDYNHPDMKIIQHLNYICKKNKVATNLLKLQKVPTKKVKFTQNKEFYSLPIINLV
ncbi:N-alpha-acetyltransferase 35, NatC auxiliary subunit [Strongyloides ratti]|uniref:Protein MAK10 homolog n=1 Tax=Strongyloides ratti TaxID=34506 RepID=A0A090L3J4_STRRB|nr:N-alpha-acetyltransferase 35, NatC auxiliary subunit [Strongyloides ratti]CEF62064.1 N-alpha-acetyltransferase 35, NatC auxiliary subunit [Strongyloides ratti]